jgi:hypothetical protein
MALEEQRAKEGCDEQSFPPPANPTMKELAQGHLPTTTRIGAPRDEQDSIMSQVRDGGRLSKTY